MRLSDPTLAPLALISRFLISHSGGNGSWKIIGILEVVLCALYMEIFDMSPAVGGLIGMYVCLAGSLYAACNIGLNITQ